MGSRGVEEPGGRKFSFSRDYVFRARCLIDFVEWAREKRTFTQGRFFLRTLHCAPTGGGSSCRALPQGPFEWVTDSAVAKPFAEETADALNECVIMQRVAHSWHIPCRCVLRP